MQRRFSSGKANSAGLSSCRCGGIGADGLTEHTGDAAQAAAATSSGAAALREVVGAAGTGGNSRPELRFADLCTDADVHASPISPDRTRE